MPPTSRTTAGLFCRSSALLLPSSPSAQLRELCALCGEFTWPKTIVDFRPANGYNRTCTNRQADLRVRRFPPPSACPPIFGKSKHVAHAENNPSRPTVAVRRVDNGGRRRSRCAPNRAIDSLLPAPCTARKTWRLGMLNDLQRQTWRVRESSRHTPCAVTALVESLRIRLGATARGACLRHSNGLVFWNFAHEAQIRAFVEPAVGGIAWFFRAAAKGSVTMNVICGTWNRVLRRCSKNPKLTAARTRRQLGRQTSDQKRHQRRHVALKLAILVAEFAREQRFLAAHLE
jgi:hypothetical protein